MLLDFVVFGVDFLLTGEKNEQICQNQTNRYVQTTYYKYYKEKF